MCLSSAIHYEARGEPYPGRVAVGSVVLNRVDDPRFPDTVCDVVSQRGQFSWYTSRPLTFGSQRDLAEGLLEGTVTRTVPSALYFSSNGSSPSGGPLVARIGSHRFYGR